MRVGSQKSGSSYSQRKLARIDQTQKERSHKFQKICCHSPYQCKVSVDSQHQKIRMDFWNFLMIYPLLKIFFFFFSTMSCENWSEVPPQKNFFMDPNFFFRFFFFLVLINSSVTFRRYPPLEKKIYSFPLEVKQGSSSIKLQLKKIGSPLVVRSPCTLLPIDRPTINLLRWAPVNKLTFLA